MSRTVFQGGTVTFARVKSLGVSLAFAALSATLISCGGSGGSESVEQTGPIISTSPGTSSTSPGLSGTTPGSSSSSLNSGLTGRIVTTEDKRPFEFDLATGESRFMPVQTIQELQTLNGVGRGVGDGYFSGTAGRGYVQSGTECFLDLGDTSNGVETTYDSCYTLYNANLERLTYVRTHNVEFGGPVKLSPSGRYLAYSLYYSNSVSRFFSEVFIVDVVTHENKVIHRQDESLNFGASYAPAFDWGPGDELVFSGIQDEQIILSEINPATFEVERTVFFPTDYNRRLRSFNLSPDGNRLLYLNRGSLQILDMNTLSITTAATSRFGDISGAQWSPDGQWIMLINDAITPLPVFDINFQATVVPSSDSMYVIPSNLTQPVEIGGNELGEAMLIRYELEDRPGQLWTGYPGYLERGPHFDWLP